MTAQMEEYVELQLEPLDDAGERPFAIGRGSGLLISDSHLRVTSADRIFLELFGMRAEDVVGRDVGEVLGHDELHEELLGVLLFDERLENHLVRARLSRAPRDRVLQISASSVRLEGDERDGLFISVEDVTC